MTRTLVVGHLADLFRQPELTEVMKLDWLRARKFLNGTWPKPMPPVLEWKSDEWKVFENAPYLVIDGEWIPAISHLTCVGIGAPGCPVVQWWTDKKDAEKRSVVASRLKELVTRIPVVFQNAMADIPILERNLGIRYEDYYRVEDTMFLHSLLWCELPHNLEFLASVYGQHEKMKHLPMNDPLYNAGDIVDTISAWEGMCEEIKRDAEVEWIYRNSLLPLIPIILEAQKCGLKVDRTKVREIERTLVAHRGAALDLASAYAGFPINLGSPKQLVDFLSYDLGKKLKKADEDTIATLRNGVLPFDPDEEVTIESTTQRIQEGGHPILEARVLYARAQQYLSHYVAPMLSSSTGRVYAEFHPWAQNTGRWSTVNPPLAQLPLSMRHALIPDEGWEWFEFDFDQIELRLIAALSNDMLLLEAFEKGYDPHLLNACDLFGLPKPKVPSKSQWMEDTEWVQKTNWKGSDDPRRMFAKPAIYRLCYGGTPEGAPSIPGASSTGLSPADLIAASKRWIAVHSPIKRFWTRLVQGSLRNRQARTFLGRRWNFLGQDMKRVKRQLYDFPMQGGVSDIMNITLIRIKDALGDNVRLCYTMHDSIKLQIRITPQLEEVKNTIREIVDTPWMIAGREIRFPAEYHERRAM